MQSLKHKNVLFLIIPIVGTVLGVTLLLSSGISNWVSNTFPTEGTDKYSYYNEFISIDELTKLSEEKSIYTVSYSQPIDGVVGSVWNSQEEANKAEEEYRAQYGAAHGLTGTDDDLGPQSQDPALAPGETTTLTQ